MTLYAFYTRREFEAQAEAEALGLTCYVPRRVDLIRQGKRRRPDAVVRPYMRGYVFIDTDDHGWHALKGCKHLGTWMAINERTAQRYVWPFIERVEADFAQRMAQIDAGERVAEYAENDLLEILDGGFKEHLLRFARIAEGANGFPLIVAKAELFGREVEIPLDPLNVRKAVA